MKTIMFHAECRRGTGYFWQIVGDVAVQARRHYGYTIQDEPFGPFATWNEAIADREDALPEIAADLGIELN